SCRFGFCAPEVEASCTFCLGGGRQYSVFSAGVRPDAFAAKAMNRKMVAACQKSPPVASFFDALTNRRISRRFVLYAQTELCLFGSLFLGVKLT
ncbi:MAG: hypothetical protein PUE14_07350, partial [Clostridia bacterium]|nr:hypothetical protein [Clostridia bacterium]